MQAFAAVAERGGFARAAGPLGVTRSAVSQGIKRLETRLGTKLLNRTTRGVSLTPAGEQLLEVLRPLLRELDRAPDVVANYQHEPVGHVRLTASRVATEIVLEQRLGPFLTRYPRVSVEVSVSDRLEDLVRGRYDAGLRRGELIEQDMIAQRVTPDTRLVCVASEGYLAEHGAPAAPADLQGRRCIMVRRLTSGAVSPWEFSRDGEQAAVKPRQALVVDDARLARAAALSGAGVARLAEDFVAGELAAGRLHSILPDWAPPFGGFHIYYAGRQATPALRALAGFLRENPAGKDTG